jgi:hypothetical protein
MCLGIARHESFVLLLRRTIFVSSDANKSRNCRGLRKMAAIDSGGRVLVRKHRKDGHAVVRKGVGLNSKSLKDRSVLYAVTRMKDIHQGRPSTASL